jgi:hypothetical protein
MPNDFNQQSQFAFLYDALCNKYPGLAGDQEGTSVFQFSSIASNANWISGSDSNAYAIANAVPLDINGFYTPGEPLDRAYADLIVSIQPANYSSNAQYSSTAHLIDALCGALQQTATDANSDYKVWCANNFGTTETKLEWLQDPLGGLSWGGQISSLQYQITQQQIKLSAIVASMDGALARAMNALSTDKMTLSVNGGNPVSVPSVSISGNLNKDLTTWMQYPDGSHEFDVIINRDTIIKKPWKQLYSSQVQQNCWSTSVSVNVNTSRIIQDVNYNLNVTAVGLTSYKITRGQWYDPDYVLPTVKISEGATVNNDTFFGIKGTLHLIPEQIIVIYRPSFKLTISTETYKQEFEANADAKIDWVNLFGFKFDFKGLASLQPVKNDNNTTTITFSSPKNSQPQILGIISKIAYNGSTTHVQKVRNQDMAAILSKNIANPPMATIQPQQFITFPAFTESRVIQIRRQREFWLGAAPFVVLNSNTKAPIGGGDCPPESAHMPYVPLLIPANVNFYIQNVGNSVPICVYF